MMFDSLDASVKHSEKQIKRFTRSNFRQAHFYEEVRATALKMKYLSSYGKCKTCAWFKDRVCKNKGRDVFAKAKPGFSCESYYPRSYNKE